MCTSVQRLPFRSANVSRFLLWNVFLLSLAACDSSSPTESTGKPGVRAITGASVTDSVDALLPELLVVEVRGTDGQVVRGAIVRFEAQPPADTARHNISGIYICGAAALNCQPPGALVVDTTDADGRVQAKVRLGQVSGRATIRLYVPELGMVDSATFTVVAGAPAKVHAVYVDTAVIVGATVTLSARVVDRYDNVRANAATFTAGTGNAVSFNASTAAVTGRDIGAQWFYTRQGVSVDSINIRVVPDGRLVVWTDFPDKVVQLVNMNGSNLRTLVTDVSSDLGAFPRFDFTRQRVTLHSNATGRSGSSNNVILIDTAGTSRRDIGPASGFTTVMAERQLADGSIFIVGQRTNVAEFLLWRVATDNTVTQLALLPGLQLLVQTYGGADISFDGTRVAYLSPTSSGKAELRVMNVASGVTTLLETDARAPRWSAQGDRVAYLVPQGAGASLERDGRATIINADGSGRRQIGIETYSPGLSWSPDGTFIIGRTAVVPNYYQFRVTRLSDNANVVLRLRSVSGVYTGLYVDFYQCDWR